MFTILDYSSALEYSIIRRYTNIVYYYYYYPPNTDIVLHNVHLDPCTHLCPFNMAAVFLITRNAMSVLVDYDLYGLYSQCAEYWINPDLNLSSKVEYIKK